LQVDKSNRKPPPPPIPEGDEEDDPNFVSDTTNNITFKQKVVGPNASRIAIRDSDMVAAVTYLLMNLEGVDTEPDMQDDSKYGDWHVFVTWDCAKQFENKYGERTTITFPDGKMVEIAIIYSDISPKSGESSNDKAIARSNSRALASALSDSATHIVLRLYKTGVANRIGLGHLKKMCDRAELTMLKGNQERLKMATKEGLVATGGKKFVWHLYVIPKVGPAMGFNWPRKLLIEVDNQIKATGYIVRESAEMGGKDDQLAIDSGPWGCKGYKQAAAALPPSSKTNTSMCAPARARWTRRKQASASSAAPTCRTLTSARYSVLRRPSSASASAKASAF
jgi:hypothetical protein